MAQFRGTVQGNRNGTSRLGHKSSGLTTTCNGWNTGVECIARYNEEAERDEIMIYEEVMSRTNWTITWADQAIMIKIYNKVFNAKKQTSSCSSCVQSTLTKLKKVYENSCEKE